jgi:transposase
MIFRAPCRLGSTAAIRCDHHARVSRDPRDSTENERLRDQLAAALHELADVRAALAEMTEKHARVNERLMELMAALERKKRPPPAPKPPPPVATLTASQAEAFDARPKPPALPPKPPKAKKPRKPSGRRPVPEHLQAETHILRPDTCELCGSFALDLVDVVEEVKLHVVREHVRRRVVERKTCRCRDCGGRTTPRSPPAPWERSKVTCEFLAWLVHAKFTMLTPLDRLRRDLATRGVPIAMGTLVSFIEKAADLLAPVDGAHWQKLLSGRWMAMDGTGIKVLVPGLSKAHDGYLELFRDDETAVFQYEPTKAAEALESKLKPFKGILTADAEHRHNGLFTSGHVLEAGCNAHGRRKFRDAEVAQPALAAEGGAFISAIYGIEAGARAQGLSGDALKTARQEVRPIQAQLLAWMDAVEPNLLPSDDLARVIRYYRNHWDALFRFVDHAECPIDNSATEREFQNLAKLRLNMLFAGSTEGAHRAAVLLGIVTTCRAIGVNAEAYFAWAFTRLGTHRDRYALDAVKVTPAAFKRELAATTTPHNAATERAPPPGS